MKTQIINAKTGEVEVRDMTSAEKHNKLIADTKTSNDAMQITIDEKNNKKASGKQKLKDLGLTDDEISSLLGV